MFIAAFQRRARPVGIAWRHAILAAFPAVLFVLSPAPASAAIRVAATIKPVYSLVASVMEGVGQPELLIGGGESPHTHAVRPSEARAMERADLIFWIGPSLEVSFIKPLAALSHGRAIALIDVPGIAILPVRPADPLREASEPARAGPDPHIWMDPENARVMVRAIAQALSAADPAHANVYAANAAATDRQLVGLEAQIAERVAPVRGASFIVFHDALQYFERRFGLASLGAVTLSPDQAPGVKRIRELHRLAAAGRVRCIFTEPQFEPAIVRTIISGTKVKAGTLDVIGAELPAGPDLYSEVLWHLAENLRDCLLPPPG
jgi:zinc transport system substrate-binding protein